MIVKIIKLQNFAICLIIFGIFLAFWYLYFGGYLNGQFFVPDSERAKEISPFITGIVLPLITIGSTLLIYLNLRNTARQNFSSNFFKLMEMHHKLRDNIEESVWEISTDDKPSKGKRFFDDICQRICFDFYNTPTVKWHQLKSDKRTANSYIKVEGLSGKEKLVVIYDYHFQIYQSSLGHYFRNLYYLVKYADDSTFQKKFKTEHVRILRAQLSNYELLLLAYNSLHLYGENFYSLVEKYELLKSLNHETKVPNDYEKQIIDIDVLIDAYPHLKKYNQLSLSNRYAKNISYSFKNINIFDYTFSLFSYKHENSNKA